MDQFLTVLESLRAEEAATNRLFTSSDGTGVRSGKRIKNPNYAAALAEVATLVSEAAQGSPKARYLLTETMTTAEFPLLFGDILDRGLLATYTATTPTFRSWAKVSSVRDFRDVARYTISGADQVLAKVGEQEEYAEESLSEGRYTYAVSKYGRRVPFAWEALINDDLGALNDVIARLGRAAVRTEEKFATTLIADANGPHASFFTSGNTNIVTSNPVLSITALQTAYKVLGAQVDDDGEPISVDVAHLIVPPALQVVAQNILQATTLRVGAFEGADGSQLEVANWMQSKVQLHVDAYLPIVSTSNGSTSWYLVADPNNGRPAVEVGFLRGHEQPEMFVKSPNAQRVGSGLADPFNGDFDTDSIQYKVRHVLGGTQMDPKMAVASKGTGS